MQNHIEYQNDKEVYLTLFNKKSKVECNNLLIFFVILH